MTGLYVWTDRPGLRASYISHMGDRPVLERIDDSLATDIGLASNIFHYPRIFTVRLRGWILIESPGRYGFRITSSGPTRLAIDGDQLISKEVDRHRKRGQIILESGLYPLEIDFDHSGMQIVFGTEMRGLGGGWGPVPPALLFAERPGPLRRLVRRALGEANRVGRNLSATTLFMMAMLEFRPAPG